MLRGWVAETQVAVRTLVRRWQFSVLAAATFAIGIAGFTLIYSVVTGLLLRPLTYPRAGELVAVYQVLPELRERRGMERLWNSFGFSYGGFRALASGAPAFEAVGAMSGAAKVLNGPEAAERVDVLRVSAGLLEVLGIHPVRGRAFARDDDGIGGSPIALISYDMWRGHFGERDDIVGQVLRLDDGPVEIVGVLPEGMTLPRSATPDIWIPIGGEPDDRLPRKTPLTVIGRLRQGATLDAARAQAANVLRAFDPGQKRDARVASWQTELTKDIKSPLLFLLGGAVLLLALTCVSVAGLLATEMQSRITEFALRNAVGATTWRLMRQLLAETLVLNTVAAIAGAWLAYTSLPALRALGLNAIPQLRMARIDGWAALTAALIATGAAAVIAVTVGATVMGKAPAILLAGRTGATRGVRGTRFAHALIATQFALAALLLVVGGLLGVNLARMNAVAPGFDPRHLVVVNVDLGRAMRSPDAARSVLDAVAARVQALPTVERVAIGSAIPFSGGNSSGDLAIAHDVRTDTVTVRFSNVLPGLIETLGLRVVAGRLFAESDAAGTAPVAVINEAMARQFWPNESAIGKTLAPGGTATTIVGVVSDVRHASVVETTMPTVYLAERQNHSRFLQLLIKSSCQGVPSCVGALAGAVRAHTAQVAPGAVVHRVDAMPDLVARTFAGDRFRTTLTALFAMIAAAISIIGIYGTTARAALQRRREIAIRLALGGWAGSTTARVVRPLASVAALGTSVGVAIALLSANIMGPFLRLVSAREPLVFAATAAAFVSIAGAAAWSAARRTTRMNPAEVLKQS